MLAVAVARSSFDDDVSDNVMVLPVLWMMSRFYIMGHIPITSHNNNGV